MCKPMEASSERKASTLVLCLGLPGSASTWVYNVCIHLRSLRPSYLVSMGYSDNAADFLEKLAGADENSAAVVIKSHYADADMRDYVASRDAKCLLSIRDPRDCIASLMERFGESFDAALINVKASCDAVMRFCRPGMPGALLLRYEDGFFLSPQVLTLLWQYLAPSEEVDLSALGGRFTQESVTRFIATFGLLDPARLVMRGRDVSDTVTHWHRSHFGDGKSGKWRSRLSSAQQDEANRTLLAALHAFGYAVA